MLENVYKTCLGLRLKKRGLTVLTYLKFLNLRYEMISNYDVTLMQNGIRRVLRGY